MINSFLISLFTDYFFVFFPSMLEIIGYSFYPQVTQSQDMYVFRVKVTGYLGSVPWNLALVPGYLAGVPSYLCLSLGTLLGSLVI